MLTKDDFGFTFIRRALAAGGRVALFDGTNFDGYSVERIEEDNTMSLKPIEPTDAKPRGRQPKTEPKPIAPAKKPRGRPSTPRTTKQSGEKKQRGRPRLQEEKRERVYLSLPPEAVEKLRQYGGGSASEGVVRLLLYAEKN